MSFLIYPYMGTVEENKDVNCCVSFAFNYISRICFPDVS